MTKRVGVLCNAILFIALGIFFVHPGIAAASPRLVVTWKADTYAPLEFHGKTFPTAGSAVRASVMLFDGASSVDLTREEVRWYANGELIASGKGVSNVALTAPSVVPAKIDLRVQLPEYGTGEFLAKTVEIPVVRPEAAVVLIPAESGEGTLTFIAHPYFFNIRSLLDLSYGWSVSGASAPTREDAHKLSIVLSSEGSPVSVNLTVKNPAKLRESASRFFSL